MTRKIRHVKGLKNHKNKDVIRVLIKYYGFYKDDQSGSHLLLKHADGRRVTVPVHPGTVLNEFVMKSIIMQAKADEQEFLNYL